LSHAILLRKSAAMNKRGEPDTIDWKILREIQRDGRVSNVELAGRVGLSPPPTLRRVQALEQAGLIIGYRAQLNREKLDYSVKMFVLVGLKSQARLRVGLRGARPAGGAEFRERGTAQGSQCGQRAYLADPLRRQD
jgi:DNA-binding Lrp family transcriptional regulator